MDQREGQRRHRMQLWVHQLQAHHSSAHYLLRLHPLWCLLEQDPHAAAVAVRLALAFAWVQS